MIDVVESSARVYRCLVHCYPGEFRRRFGAEMADTFEQQLTRLWNEDGFIGFLLAWSMAARELLRIALPGQAARPGVAIPVLSAALAAAVWMPLVWALSNPLALFTWYHHITGGVRH